MSSQLFLPWRIENACRPGQAIAGGRWLIRDAADRVVCSFDAEPACPNVARHIIHCVNWHGEFVESMTDTAWYIDALLARANPDNSEPVDDPVAPPPVLPSQHFAPDLHDELVAALESSLKSLNSLWKSEVRGSEDPENCPYKAYAEGISLLARAKGEA